MRNLKGEKKDKDDERQTRGIQPSSTVKYLLPWSNNWSFLSTKKVMISSISLLYNVSTKYLSVPRVTIPKNVQ